MIATSALHPPAASQRSGCCHRINRCRRALTQFFYNNTVNVETGVYALASTATYWVSANGFFSHLSRDHSKPIPSLSQLVFATTQTIGAQIGYSLFFGFCVLGSATMLYSTFGSSHSKIMDQLVLSKPTGNDIETPNPHLTTAEPQTKRCCSKTRSCARYYSAFYKSIISLSSFAALMFGLANSIAITVVASSLVFPGVFMAQVINLSADRTRKHLLSPGWARFFSVWFALGYALSQGALYFNQLDQLIMRMGCDDGVISDNVTTVAWHLPTLIFHLLWLVPFMLKSFVDYQQRIYDFFVKDVNPAGDHQAAGSGENGKSTVETKLLAAPAPTPANHYQATCCQIRTATWHICCNIKATSSSIFATSYKAFISSIATFPAIYYDLLIKPHRPKLNTSHYCFPLVAPIQFGVIECIALFLVALSFRAILSQFKPQSSLSCLGARPCC